MANVLDRALDWALTDRTLTYDRICGPRTGDAHQPPLTLDTHDVVAVHDAPFVQAVVEVLEAAAADAASAPLLRAAGDLFAALHGASYEDSAAVRGVGAVGLLTGWRPREAGLLVSGQTSAAAVSALRVLQEAASMADEGDADGVNRWILLEELPFLIHTAAHLVASPDDYRPPRRSPNLLR
ncbi:hypothetical protein [Streptomyces sp. SM12]|uniref:hypothetical protein n=1 Tax=Streptomyces sp. SM12 TaxID=1071602 RepID=UPI0015E17DEA|nr:hypothetical protein [Streptomyces sp. SM12]